MTIDIYAVGGYDEVGQNMTTVKYKDQAVIFDMGISLDNLLISGRKSFETLRFSDLKKDGVIPNDNIISGFQDQVKAIILSHGHLDHCVHGDTYIQLHKTIEKIKDIDTDPMTTSIDLTTLNQTPAACIKVHKVESNGKLYKIKTKTDEVKVTGEHKFLVLDRLSLKERKAYNLRQGDVIPVLGEVDYYGKPQKIPKFKPKRRYKNAIRISEEGRVILKKERRKRNLTQKSLSERINLAKSTIGRVENKGRCSKSTLDRLLSFYGGPRGFYTKYVRELVIDQPHQIKFPKLTSPKFCQFLGYMLGDGNNDRGYLKCTDKNIDNLKTYKKLGEEIFGTKGNIKIGRRKNLIFGSSLLASFLNKLGEILVYSPQRKIPEFLHKVTKKELTYFLRGLYDAEGSVKDHQIDLASTSENIINIVKYFLLRFGIVSHIYEGKTKRKGKFYPAYYLEISHPKSIEKFHKTISFSDPEKREKLKDLIKKVGNGVGERIYLIPLKKEAILKILEVFNLKKVYFRKRGIRLYHYLNGHAFSKEKFRRLVSLLEKHLDNRKVKDYSKAKRILTSLKKLLNPQIIWERIRKIEKVDADGPVYDLTIPGYSNYIANRILVHNCSAAPKLSHRYKCPIISRSFTIDFLKKLIKEEKIYDTKNPLVKLSPNQRYRVSKDLEIELVHVTHSIPQTAIIVLHTPEGRVVYANDYKLDNYPMLGNPPDYKKLKEIGREGVKALIVESLYIHLKEKTPPEKSVKDMLMNIIPNLNPDKAIVATCFSSHIERVKSLVEVAKKTGRKLVFLGRSLSEYLAVAKRLDLINLPKGCIYRPPRVKRILRKVEKNRENYFIIMTGSQGEPDAILSRIAKGQYKFDFQPGDQVIFSCSVIPSPINISNRTILERRLEKKGVRIFRDVHVSGHAHREDHRTLINLLNPEHVIPTHAETQKLGMFADFLMDLNKEYGERKYQLGDTIHILESQQKTSI